MLDSFFAPPVQETLDSSFASPVLGEGRDFQLVRHRFVEMMIDGHLDAVRIGKVFQVPLAVIAIRVAVPEHPALDVDDVARRFRETPPERHPVERVMESGLV